METPELQVTSAEGWKGKVAVEGSPLELPSKNVALVRQIQPQAFLTSGMIPDPLSAIVRKAVNTKQGLPPKAMEQISDDPKMLASAFEMFDRVLTFVVLEPVIKMPPTCDHLVEDTPCDEYANTDAHTKPSHPRYHQYHEGQRLPGVLYADQVDMDDKVFIFNWCLGGTRDLSKFRQELSAGMETVPKRKNVQRKAK